MRGIGSYGVYVPRGRLSRRAMVDANRWFNSGLAGLAKGERAYCNWDEDSVTMAVEAAARAARGSSQAPTKLWLASTSLPFQDRQNAGIVSAAIGLDESVSTQDFSGSARAATSALVAALSDGRPGDVLLVGAENRQARAGSQDELLFGDAAAAVVLTDQAPVAEVLAVQQRSVDFVDHYRGAGRDYDYGWEERWIRDEGYLKLFPPVVMDALKAAGITAGEVQHAVIPAPTQALADTVGKKLGLGEGVMLPVLQGTVGFTGSTHPLLLLAAALDRASPGDIILLTGFGQGCDALVLRATPALGRMAGRPVLEAALAGGRQDTNYQRYLAFNDLVEQERGLRAELDTQTPPSVLYRNRRMLYGFFGGKCERCGTMQFPKAAICVNPNCHAHHSQTDIRFAEIPATLQSFTADNLTYCPDPPARYGMVRFEGAGCLMMDIADAVDGEVAVGKALTMAFRIKVSDERRGFKRYFWKAKNAATAA